MKLLSIVNVVKSVLDEQVFRTSSLRDHIIFSLFGVLFLACVGHYTLYSISSSTGFWGNVGYLWIGFWLGLIAWLSWLRFKASLLPSNWLVKMDPGHVLIKFRSFQNYYYPECDPVVIELLWREIAWARKTRETAIKQNSDAAVTEFFTYLDLKLNLSDEVLKEIGNAIAKERNTKPLRSAVGKLKHELFQARKRKAPKHEIDDIKQRLGREKTIMSQQKKIPSAKHHDYPVRLVNDAVLRIRWNAVKPDIDRALVWFSDHTSVEAEIKITSDSTGNLGAKALDDMILDRVMKGDTTDAITLVKQHYGYSTTEAKLFIDELTGNLSHHQSGQ
ncbi:MAG: hypothetical protein GY732_11805 [Gammaproteobacteria bacterium]|nr:hypothetical protein [Gammaproteobacteria bacterium]